MWHLEIIVRKIKILGSKRGLGSMFKFRGREVFYLLGKVKTFPNEKSNNVKQILVLLLLYANPTVAAMEEN